VHVLESGGRRLLLFAAASGWLRARRLPQLRRRESRARPAARPGSAAALTGDDAAPGPSDGGAATAATTAAATAVAAPAAEGESALARAKAKARARMGE
jgi:hypothetical protein